MGRPPMPLGTWGKIRTYAAHVNDKGKTDRYRATTDYRDFDGKVRRVERFGKTIAAAENALKIALKERAEVGQAGELTRAHRFSDAAELWLGKVQAAAEGGRRSPGTVDTYRQQLGKNVLPALGNLRLGEVTTPILDRYIDRLKTDVGVATARTCRSIVSGVMGLAVRYKALALNPVREIERIEGGTKRDPRALTGIERVEWFSKLEADKDAVAKDLPDLCRFLLATGVRIGEALAVIWSEIDLETGTVSITSTVLRVKGVGLVRKRTKSRAGERVLQLPRWALDMLFRRYMDGPRLDEPVFPDTERGWRDPSNTSRALRDARGSEDFAWVTSHVFRKTAATILDEAGFSARVVADQLGHSRPSMTQDVYLGRKVSSPHAATALDGAFDSPSGDVNRG